MTFAELFDALKTQGILAPSRLKDIPTSLRYLAKALEYDGLDDAIVGEACRDPERWSKALQARFDTLAEEGKGVGPVTRKNTRSNIRAAFREAERLGLLREPLPSRLLQAPTKEAWIAEQ